MTAIRVFILLMLVTGLAYPLVMTGLSQTVFPVQANGSPVVQNGRVTGSTLIGEWVTNPRYFGGRPSASNYNALPSSGRNWSPSYPDYRATLSSRKPTNLTQASASGLDPDITPEAARAQVDRIVESRSLDPVQRASILRLIDTLTQGKQFGILGTERVRVRDLNQGLDRILK